MGNNLELFTNNNNNNSQIFNLGKNVKSNDLVLNEDGVEDYHC